MTIVLALTGIAITLMAAKFGGAIIRFALWMVKFAIGAIALTGVALVVGIVLANLFG